MPFLPSERIERLPTERTATPLLFDPRQAGDREQISAILETIDPALDLSEPFCRIREAMAAVVATNGGRPRAQAREALKGLLDPLPTTQSKEGCCGHQQVR